MAKSRKIMKKSEKWKKQTSFVERKVLL